MLNKLIGFSFIYFLFYVNIQISWIILVIITGPIVQKSYHITYCNLENIEVICKYSFSVTFSISQRGGRLLIYNGYSYSLLKSKIDSLKWRCTMSDPITNGRCAAMITTNINHQVMYDTCNHRHNKLRYIIKNEKIMDY